MATLKKLIKDAPKMRGSLPVKAKKGASIKKAQDGLDTLYTKKDKVGNVRTNKYVGRMPNGNLEMGKVTKTKDDKGKTTTVKEATQSFHLGRRFTDDEIRKSMNQRKNGGAVKAKDGKWIQKAVNPKHKGSCTPMTKATCTPKRKALAKTFKAMAKKNKK
jgi:hypothetical protein